MTMLLTAHNLSKSFGSEHLFEGISFTVSEGDRVGLIGPNGSGKSTLLKILIGLENPNEGSLSRRQGLSIGYACQSPEFPSVSLEELLLQNAKKGDERELLTQARILLAKAQFSDFSLNAATLSGGWKKRLDIVRALMQDPDLLLLDEPTNHLDLEGILWLEKFLLRERRTFIVISHDRYFLENVSNRIIELNACFPQGLFVSQGNMSTFLERKESFLEAQLQQERGLASTVREEMEWLKRSPKARTTKSKSRVEKAQALLDELSQIRNRNKKTKISIDFSSEERDTRNLIVAKNLSKSLGGKQLFKGVDLKLSPGTRLGIVGKNGTGKTTLMKILAGQIPQDLGTLKYAQDLRLVYFDQHREEIPSDIRLKEALSPQGDFVNYRGQSIHVNGWAKKFLFSPERLNLPVHCLSGGEKARILIAKLMLKPADVLFLDEPTNDLDIQTLEVIEESLIEFPGAVVLISHDRCLMDRVCTQILGLGHDQEQHLFADYNQWERACEEASKKKEEIVKPVKEKPATPSSSKLSYKEKKELEGMEQAILQMEKEIDALEKALALPQTQEESPQKILDLYHQLASLQKQHEGLFERWQFLLDKSK